jgi:2-polyprenyl-3-methyl-5-hydroxy-6-metoxy-1,4-benzoquinol methylase
MSFISVLFDSSENPLSLGAKFRKKRLEDFESLVLKTFDSNQSIRILDVGGAEYFWKNSALLQRNNFEILLLNLQKTETTHSKIKSVAGDATAMPEFLDKSFDIVFSNSVIEHLYTFENQKKMAKEILRVGKSFFVQTPNSYFPIESHYALPFAQFMPKKLLFFLLTQTKLSRLAKWNPKDAQQYLDEIRLLNESEMKTLFPGSKIYKEKFFGMVKSIASHNLG